MAEEQDPSTASHGIKKFVLKLWEKEPVTTGQGTFYARPITVGDLKAFNGYFDKDKEKVNAELKAFGELSLKTLVCTDSGPEKTPALTEEIYTKLTDDDIRALAAGVAKACDLGPLLEGDVLEALGASLFDSVSQQAKRLDESAAKIKQTLDKRFGSLSETAKATLGDNLTGLSAIRESLRMSDAMKSTRKAQEDFQRILDAVPKNISSQVLRDAGLEKSVSEIDVQLFRPPLYEETAAGRAASRAATAGEESARQLHEVAGLVGQMAEQMGKLQTVFLIDVLPQWFKDLEARSDATNTTLGQAERSLFWAKWALIVSVLVTILMTSCQLRIAHEYKLENDAQQNASASIMREQLLATQELNEQLAADSKRLKEEVMKLNQSVESHHTPKSAEFIRPKVEKIAH